MTFLTMGLVSYAVIKLTGRWREAKPMRYLIAALLLVYRGLAGRAPLHPEPERGR